MWGDIITKDYEFDALDAKDQCVKWIQDFFEENGKGCNAVVGISGGKDSSVVAALCVEALGRDRVIGVLMPNDVQSDIDFAKLLVNHLGIKHYIINVKDAINGVLDQMIKSDIEISEHEGDYMVSGHMYCSDLDKKVLDKQLQETIYQFEHQKGVVVKIDDEKTSKDLKDAISEYSKRLSKFCNLNIIELSDEKLPSKLNDSIITSLSSLSSGASLTASIFEESHVYSGPYVDWSLFEYSIWTLVDVHHFKNSQAFSGFLESFVIAHPEPEPEEVWFATSQ